ncbi:MAG: hypothetical protein HZB13_20485 [Acidobacteria bacterium]|nr:hypothetical protein [Acidobacteriota bacterium]
MTRRTALAIFGAWRAAAAQKRIAIRGMYSHPKAFWDRGAKLDDYGVTALFVHGGSITAELLARAGAEGARVFAEFATLNGKGYVEKHPEAWPVNERGERAPAATWFLGACPTEPGFRALRMKQLEELLERRAVAGVWLDYFHWHAQFEDPHPILPETCFCESCLAAFAARTGVRAPQGETAMRARWILERHERAWRRWRVDVLLDWAREAKAVVRRVRPSALLGVYHCPWTDEEFGGARERILGLDLKQLAGVADVLSPMVYHGRMERKAEWVGDFVAWLSRRVGKRCRIWPIVQAQSEPREITADEFERVLRLGGGGGATGVMMFTAQSVAADGAKMDAMRRVYGEWGSR